MRLKRGIPSTNCCLAISTSAETASQKTWSKPGIGSGSPLNKTIRAANWNSAGLYAGGKGATPNYKESAKWLRKAADHNEALSESMLGFLYANGYGVSQ